MQLLSAREGRDTRTEAGREPALGGPDRGHRDEALTLVFEVVEQGLEVHVLAALVSIPCVPGFATLFLRSRFALLSLPR